MHRSCETHPLPAGLVTRHERPSFSRMVARVPAGTQVAPSSLSSVIRTRSPGSAPYVAHPPSPRPPRARHRARLAPPALWAPRGRHQGGDLDRRHPARARPDQRPQRRAGPRARAEARPVPVAAYPARRRAARAPRVPRRESRVERRHDSRRADHDRQGAHAHPGHGGGPSFPRARMVERPALEDDRGRTWAPLPPALAPQPRAPTSHATRLI